MSFSCVSRVDETVLSTHFPCARFSRVLKISRAFVFFVAAALELNESQRAKCCSARINEIDMMMPLGESFAAAVLRVERCELRCDLKALQNGHKNLLFLTFHYT